MNRLSLPERPAAREELRPWYSRLLAIQASSDMSMAEFARRSGVSVPSLYQWRRRLLDEDVDGSSSPKLIEVNLPLCAAILPA